MRTFDERDHGTRDTIGSIPPAVDAALRRRARAGGKNLNEVAVDAVMEAAGIGGRRRTRRDLAAPSSSWSAAGHYAPPNRSEERHARSSRSGGC